MAYPLILTLTPNPTIDRTIFVRNFRLGTVIRAEREVVTPSGKGVDASLVIHELGGTTMAIGLNAGLTGRLLAGMLDERGIPYDFVPAHGETRMAIVLVDLAVGNQSTISAPTLTGTPGHLAQLLERLSCHAEKAWGVICAGSLPPGLPADSYAHLICRARQCGLVTLLDTSGEALRCGVAGQPHILKINQHELRELERGVTRAPYAAGSEASRLTPGEITALARKLKARLGKWAGEALIITLGEQGALLVSSGGSYHAQPPKVPVVNTAGAGDALNAGLLLKRSAGADWPTALRLGVTAAASVVANEGTAICRRAQVEELLSRVHVTPVE